jgi:RNA polymerase sigma factor (sigma-70 family)
MKGALLPGTEPNPPRGERFDPGAFYDEHRAELIAFFDRTAQGLGIAEPAEDVYHDAWLKLVAHHERVDTLNPRRAVAWVKKVGTNILLDKVREGYGKFEQPQPDVVIIGAESEHDAVNPAEQWVAREDLRRMVMKMPRKLAEVFVHDADGYSNAEIADMLDLTPAAVQKRLTRARMYARNRLAIVAGFVPIDPYAHLARALRRLLGKPSQVLVTGIGSLSVVLAFGVPTLPGAVALPASTAQGVIVRTLVPGNGRPSHASTAQPRTPDKTPTVAAGSMRHAGKTGTTGLVPRVPKTCAPHLCVSSACPDSDASGDRVYLKPTNDPCAVVVTEGYTPVCPYVPHNPIVGCHRDGDPQWAFNPPPPPSPKGGPL